jgi:uncharacterized membrane protein YjjP (DUF1212 family)
MSKNDLVTIFSTFLAAVFFGIWQGNFAAGMFALFAGVLISHSLEGRR